MIRLASFFVALTLLSPAWAEAQVDANAEARAHFERGNAALERARRSRGARQRRHLEQALSEFVETLRFVRSRNALFNAGIVLEQLDRDAEAFAYFQEYMQISGLTEEERSDGQARIDAITPSLALLRVLSDPPGAEVFVDRLDLAARGQTPITIAVAPGDHTIHLRLPHHEDAQATMSAVVGQQAELRRALTPNPVPVTFEVLAPPGSSLEVDGQPVDGLQVGLPPGPHVARLLSPGRAPVEQRFVVVPGEPLGVRLDAAAASALPGTIVVRTAENAIVRVDGAEIGSGAEVRHQIRAGSHMVQVSAPGSAPYEQLVSVAEGQTVEVNVELGAAGRRRLGPVPHIAAALTGAAAIGFGVLAVIARSENNGFEDRCPEAGRPACEADFASVEDANRRADLVLGIAGGLALTTVVLYLLNRRTSSESRGDVRIVADRNQAGAVLRGTF